MNPTNLIQPYLENLRERKAIVAVLRVVGDELADEIASPVADGTRGVLLFLEVRSDARAITSNVAGLVEEARARVVLLVPHPCTP